MSLTSKQMRQSALIYAANVLYTCVECGAFAEVLSEEENHKFQDEVMKIACRLLKNRKDFDTITRISCIDEIIEYVKSND